MRVDYPPPNATREQVRRLTVTNTHRAHDPYPVMAMRVPGERMPRGGVVVEGWTYPPEEQLPCGA